MRHFSSYENKRRGTVDFPVALYHVDSTHPRYEMPFHWHMEEELILVQSGTFRLSVDGNVMYLGEGDCAYIVPGMVHGGMPEHCVYQCMVFDIGSFFQKNMLYRAQYQKWQDMSKNQPPLFRAGSGPGRLIQSLFHAMSEEKTAYELVVMGLLWQFMGMLLGEETRTGTLRPAPRWNSEGIKRVLNRIHMDYGRKLTLDELAEEAGMASRYLCRVFKEVTGRTPIDYVNYYRVECASELLCASADSVLDIALACGFEEAGYFSRVFRNYKGMSPREYRVFCRGASRQE